MNNMASSLNEPTGKDTDREVQDPKRLLQFVLFMSTMTLVASGTYLTAVIWKGYPQWQAARKDQAAVRRFLEDNVADPASLVIHRISSVDKNTMSVEFSTGCPKMQGCRTVSYWFSVVDGEVVEVNPLKSPKVLLIDKHQSNKSNRGIGLRSDHAISFSDSTS